jgi:hypothetical protein
LVNPWPNSHTIAVVPFEIVTLATPPEQPVIPAVGVRVPVQVPTSASPSVGLEVEMSRSTPAVSVLFPGTLITFGLVVEGLIVTVTDADWVGSAWLVAVMVTLAGLGTDAGAV